MNIVLTRRLKNFFAYFFITLLIIQSSGCYYYRVKSVNPPESADFFRTTILNQYFVVHQKDSSSFRISYIQVDSTHLLAQVRTPDSVVIHYDETRTDKRYKNNTAEQSIINEVHIYLTEDAPLILPDSNNKLIIPYDQVQRIDVIDIDTGKTIASHIFTAVGIGIGALVVIGVIALLTKSSCPYVYVHNGQGFVFQGETFGGAIMKNMARDDYMPLPQLQAVDGSYQVRITNELKERQYTDIAELLVVDHDPHQRVLLDQKGQAQLINSAVAPRSATSSLGIDLREELATTDLKYFLFAEENDPVNSVELTFNKPLHATTGKLVLNAKNSLWLDYLYGKFAEKLGNRFEPWMEQRAEVPTEERWQNQVMNHVPLSIYLQEGETWKPVTHLPTVGPLAARDFVVPIDLSNIDGEEVRLKIETGFLFWELDYVAMDFSPQQELEIRKLPMTSAIGTDGIDWREALRASDEQYMDQLTIGEVTELHFDYQTPPPGQVQTTFLHTRGYYELIREFEGTPQMGQLRKFKQSGYFPVFSLAEYQNIYEASISQPVADK